MSDVTLNSSKTLQAVTRFNAVNTTMDTCRFTLLNPNLLTIAGPVAVTAISTGIYQFPIGPGVLSLEGQWQAIWYFQLGQQSLQQTQIFTVGS